MNTAQSAALLERARTVIPGGVNSPVRAFTQVGGTPRFITSAKGSRLYDADGNSYIDLVNAWGPMILGHGHPDVIAAMREQLEVGMSYGAPTEAEVKLAELIISMVPNIERVRLTNSGTEACMTAVRLARAVTDRTVIVKASGCYHGHADPFLVGAGSGVLTLGIPSSPGVPHTTTSDTIVIPFNDLEAVDDVFRRYRPACIIIEPVAGNMGCIPPDAGYLEGLRERCDSWQTLLIFDEVMTGFRLAPGGAQEYLGVMADIVVFGKVIGGGMPIGAIAGRAEILDRLAPVGDVYQAGTLSGNPLATACGITTLSTLQQQPQIYSRLAQQTAALARGIEDTLQWHNIPATVNRCGSMMSVHVGITEMRNLSDARRQDVEAFTSIFHHLLRQGVMLPPSAFETWFISAALTDDDVSDILSAVSSWSASVRRGVTMPSAS